MVSQNVKTNINFFFSQEYDADDQRTPTDGATCPACKVDCLNRVRALQHAARMKCGEVIRSSCDRLPLNEVERLDRVDAMIARMAREHGVSPYSTVLPFEWRHLTGNE